MFSAGENLSVGVGRDSDGLGEPFACRSIAKYIRVLACLLDDPLRSMFVHRNRTVPRRPVPRRPVPRMCKSPCPLRKWKWKWKWSKSRHLPLHPHPCTWERTLGLPLCSDLEAGRKARKVLPASSPRSSPGIAPGTNRHREHLQVGNPGRTVPASNQTSNQMHLKRRCPVSEMGIQFTTGGRTRLRRAMGARGVPRRWQLEALQRWPLEALQRLPLEALQRWPLEAPQRGAMKAQKSPRVPTRRTRWAATRGGVPSPVRCG